MYKYRPLLSNAGVLTSLNPSVTRYDLSSATLYTESAVTSDLMFAVDSIPAIFAVTRDPFLVYTSNVFAILGLRAMFFLLAGVMDKFAYLKTGLAVILAYVGFKMLAIEFYHVPPGISLLVIAAILAVAIAWSLLRPPQSHRSGH